MSELEQALSIITGMTPDQRGFRAKAVKEMGVSHGVVYNWFTRGYSPTVATKVWEATGRKVDLVKLIEASKQQATAGE